MKTTSYNESIWTVPVFAALLIAVFAVSGLSTVTAQSTADAHGDAIEVTMRVNTATVPDTLREQDIVQVRGAINGHDWENETYLDQTIRWSAESSIIAENVGGDYWETSLYILPGDTLMYKFWTGFELDPDEEPTANGGWEWSDDRQLAVPEDHTDPIVLDLAYYDQVELFEEKADTVGVFFRVHLGFQIDEEGFDPTDEDFRVGIRGDGLFDWGETLFFLDVEDFEEESNNVFYSGVYYADEGELADIDETNYKFVIHRPDEDEVVWEDAIGDRHLELEEVADTTVHWVYFNNQAPLPPDVERVVTDIQFAVNVNILENLGIFDRSIDGVEVRGSFNNWSGGDAMNWNPTLRRYQLTRNYPEGSPATVGQRYEFKYYINWDESREDETSDNYIPGLSLGAGWEEPGVTGGGNRTYTITDKAEQYVYPVDEGHHYYNGIAGAAVIFSELIPGNPETYPITFRIDMSRAETVPDAEERFNPEQDSVFIAFEEQIFAFTQGFGTGSGHVNDAPNLVRNENYLLEDVDGDGIYEITVDAELPTVNSFGFIIGYGQPNVGEGTILWNGGGFESGRRYYQFITPESTFYDGDFLFSNWPAEPELNLLQWYGGEEFGDDGLTVETAPDYAALATSADQEPVQTVNTYRLDQNYPNPFNPTTSIRFTIPESHDVRLDVYNILGQRVATLVNTQMTAGTHTVPFDATRLSSGTYIYRLQAGDFVQQRQMMLIK